MMTINDVKKFGFGLMRLPRLEDGKIDVEQTKTMVDMFLEAGFNYFDTAFVYEGSEEATKKALVERHNREDYFLATKMAAWASKEGKEGAIKQFETSLNRTGAGYFDFYLLHNLGDTRTLLYDEYGLWDYVRELKSSGKIKYFGFSFHSNAVELDEILTKHPEVDFVQLQINYADWNNPQVQSRLNYETTQKHGKKVVVMEPVKGGTLANPPKNIKEVFDRHPYSYASWAVKYAASLDGVLTVLSGMSNIEQMADNLKTMKDFVSFNDEEKEVMNEVMVLMSKAKFTGCTGCKYCVKVCPNNVPVNSYFSALDTLNVYENNAKAQTMHDNAAKDKTLAKDCLKCGACESVCPQHLSIRDLLETVVEKFEG